jgi:hypothetical protein
MTNHLWLAGTEPADLESAKAELGMKSLEQEGNPFLGSNNPIAVVET